MAHADERVTPHTIAVCGAVTSFADDAGFAWPSIPSIAARARCCENTVRREINLLVELGYLEVERSRGGPGQQRGSCNFYTVVVGFMR